MNWEHTVGNWQQLRKQLKVDIKQQWEKLTDDHLDVIAGKRQHLSNQIQEVYGITKDETEKQITEWQSRQKNHAY